MRWFATSLVGLTLLASCCVTAAAEELNVPVSISEPIGVARQAFPATGGVPFAPGQVKEVADLTLLDAQGKPVPAQFSKLAGYEDGSVQWALVDVLADVPANGKTQCTIRAGKAAAPTRPLKITESADAVVVDTGAIQFTVSKRSFNLFDSVTVGGKKVVAGGAVTVTGGKGVWYEQDRKTKTWAERTDDTQAGKSYAAGRPTRVKWEYRGPLRATLRIDGDYLDGDKRWLAYTTRITAWAGSGAVRVEHSLRNSNPAEGNDAFIARAALAVRLAVEAKGQGGGEDWSAGGDGTVGLLIQNRHTGGIYRGPGTYLRKTFGCGWSTGWPGLYGQKVAGDQAFVETVSKGPTTKGRNGALGFTKEGVFALADRSHKDSEIWLDFYAGSRDESANAARGKAFRSKLLLVAPGDYYSRTEALGIGHFGTLADEVATYRKWGWKGWDNPKNYPTFAHEPFAFVPMEWIHDVSEDDAVEGYLLQFLRTGDRGFFDWAEAYNGFYRCHSIYRTDWGAAWGVAGPAAKRENKGQGFGWYGPHVFGWPDSRMHDCHHYGRGIFDYYCLTGNTDSLEAGLDLADEMSARWDRYKPGGRFGFRRSFGRQWLTVLRAWQVTRDEKWKKIADHWAATVLQANNWDPKLKFYRSSLGMGCSYFARDWAKGHFDMKSAKWTMKRDLPPRLDKYLTDNKIACRYDRGRIMVTRGEGDGKQEWEVHHLTQMFELSACHMAMERYARIFNSEPMKKRLVEVSEGVNGLYWSDKCHHMIGSPYIGWPDKDKVLDPGVWDDSHANCPNDPGGVHSGYSTRYAADMFARAYSFTGDAKWLELAKRSWDRGSKRLYQRKEQSFAADEVGPFAYIRGAHKDSLLECSARLFYEAPRAK